MAMETMIHTIRHAQTGFNAEKRYAGSLDVPLSPGGIREAKEVAKKLRKIKFDIIVTSTLRRAVETAKIFSNGTIPLAKSHLCIERNFGIFEGKTWDEVQKIRPPVLYINVGGDLHSVNPKGSEHFEDLWTRAKQFRNYLFRRYQGKNILVVSHGVFLQMFHGVMRDSSCIESLAVCPSNLEFSTFRFLNSRLVEEKSKKLIVGNMNF